MGKNASEDEILRFLRDFKRAMERRSVIFARPNKTKESLTEIGLTTYHAEGVILGLTVNDYSKGPEKDLDAPGVVWLFGKTIGGIEIYIKLKLDDIYPVCISFHAAAYKMRLPYQRGA